MAQLCIIYNQAACQLMSCSLLKLLPSCNCLSSACHHAVLTYHHYRRHGLASLLCCQWPQHPDHSQYTTFLSVTPDQVTETQLTVYASRMMMASVLPTFASCTKPLLLSDTRLTLLLLQQTSPAWVEPVSSPHTRI